MKTKSTPWTRFHDMSSGGSRKTDYRIIFIEAPEQPARAIFEHRFQRDPDNITCHCCGNDFSVWETEKPDFDENGRDKVLVISLADMTTEERKLYPQATVNALAEALQEALGVMRCWNDFDTLGEVDCHCKACATARKSLLALKAAKGEAV